MPIKNFLTLQDAKFEFPADFNACAGEVFENTESNEVEEVTEGIFD